jgi:hypothetical protein
MPKYPDPTIFNANRTAPMMGISLRAPNRRPVPWYNEPRDNGCKSRL